MPYIGFSGVSPAKGFGWSSGPSGLVVDYLVVAGGGAGGSQSAPGRGGGGGLRSTVTATGGGGSLESALSINLPIESN